jgi:hypothetical protein
MMQAGMPAGQSQATQDNILTVISTLEKNFEHARELLNLISETADTLIGPRPQPVEDRPATPPVTMVSRLRQADLNINAALAAMRNEMMRLRNGLGLS